MEVESEKDWSMVGDGAKERATSNPRKRYMTLAGRGEEQVVYEGFRRDPLVVGEKGFGAVGGRLGDWG